MEYNFSWDPKKANSNLRKHGVGFEQAATVFMDRHAISIYDPMHSQTEDRWITIGLSATVGLLVIHHTCDQISEEAVNIRIISSRKAARREIAQYNG